MCFRQFCVVCSMLSLDWKLIYSSIYCLSPCSITSITSLLINVFLLGQDKLCLLLDSCQVIILCEQAAILPKINGLEKMSKLRK